MSADERKKLELDISDALSERCSCSFPQRYITNGHFVCSSSPSANTVVFQGRLISTQDVDSVELLLYLKEWLLTEPTIVLDGISLQAAENYKDIGNATHATPCKWPPRRYREYQQSIIGAAVSGGLLVLVALIAFIMVAVCSCRRHKVYKKTT